jgi:phosphotransferase family enzyme
MKDSNHPAIAPSAIDCGYVQAAQRRVEAMRVGKVKYLEAPTLLELEQAWLQKVEKCELWKTNWRNRVYRVELAGGGAAVAKQLVMGTDARFQCEYDQLGKLARLQIPGLRVPKLLAVLPAKRTYVMELARGKTIPTLVWNRKHADDLLKACELAGKILARIHVAWTQKICPMPLDLLAQDLAATPWHLSSREGKILQLAFESLARAEVRMGHVYYDCTPANFLFQDGELFLIDPPAVLRQGVQLWDFSVFRSSMRRESWRLSLRRPFDRQRVVARQSLSAFERSYLASFSEPHPEPALFPLAARLFDLQRTAVLMTIQKGRVYMARESTPIASDARLFHSLANRITLPLLEMEKRWLFRQLARELTV